MNQNEQQTIDLVVGPLSSFDDAVAFGDALYSLEGVTRLALNEFEEGRASFTFTVRSLETTRAALHNVGDFAISSVEELGDGTFQLTLGPASTATAAPAPVPAAVSPAFESSEQAEPKTYESHESASEAVGFAAENMRQQEFSRDPFRASPEPVVASPANEYATQSAIPSDADSGWAAESADTGPLEADFSSPPAAPKLEAAALDTFDNGNEPYAPTSEAAAAAYSSVDKMEEHNAPAHAVHPQAAPTPHVAPLEQATEQSDPLDSQWSPIDAQTPALEPEPVQQIDNEVARLIIQIAGELRGAADNLAELAVRLSGGGAPPAWEQQAAQSWESSPAPAYAEETDDYGTNQEADEYSAPAYKEPEPTWQPQSVEQGWNSEQPGWEAQPAEHPASAQDQGAQPADESEEERAWEAPPMPSIGAINPLPRPADQGAGQPSDPDKASLANAQAVALATAMGRKPTQVSLMATGFASFADANRFIAALRQVPGVRNVAISELDQGRLRLSLDYFGSQPLEGYLNDLQQAFPHHVVKASAHEIEIQLMAA